MELSEITINQTLVTIHDYSGCCCARRPYGKFIRKHPQIFFNYLEFPGIFKVIRKGVFPTRHICFDRTGEWRLHHEIEEDITWNNIMVQDVDTGHTFFTHSSLI